MDIKQAIKEADEMVQKNVTTADISTTANSSTLRPALDLDNVIVDLAGRPTPFVDTFYKNVARRESGVGDSFTFNTNEALNDSIINPRDAVYGDGLLPNTLNTEFGQTTVAYRAIGYSGGVTGLARAQGEAVLDLYNNEVQRKMSSTYQALEWLSFWGSTTTLNSSSLAQFPGLDELITTNVVDASNTALYGKDGKAVIDEAANLIAQRGGMSTHMFVSTRTGININNTYNGNERIQITTGGGSQEGLQWGNTVASVQTVAGNLRIVPDFFLNPGNTFILPNGSSSSPSGAATSKAFIISEPYVAFKVLSGLMLETIGKTADKDEFFVRTYAALKVTAEKFMAKIENINDTIQKT